MHHFFRFRSGYKGEQDFEAHVGGRRCLLRVRTRAGEEERRGTCYTDEAWEREVVASVGLVIGDEDVVTPALVRAFNEWRAAEHAATVHKIASRPERYGVPDLTRPEWAFLLPPPVLRGGWWKVRWNADGPDRWKHGCVGLGWQIVEPEPAAG